MFIDLTDKSIQPSGINSDVPEILLSDPIRNELQSVLEDEDNYARVYGATSVVKTDNNYVFFSNHWYYLAVLCREYAQALFPYCTFFDEKIRNNSEMVNDLAKEKYDNEEFNNLFADSEDRDRMINFIKGDSDFRPGKALLNVRDGNRVAIRSCRDIFGSCVLKKIAVPDASSAYLGNVVYYLAKHSDLYEKLENEINDFLEEQKNSPDDETLDLRKQFESYITDVLGKKSTRQVRDLGNLSKMLVEAGVLEKDVYSISDVDEYRDVAQTIKSSKEYLDDKAAKKEKSPSSGLAYDQGITNYERFLVYLKGLESSQKLIFKTGIKAGKPRNRIVFGAPGTGKSFKLNEDRKALLGADNETDYERVTFHPDYSYANFVGTYKPVMVSSKKSAADKDTDYVISILNDEGKTAQEKYDVLFERFKDDGLTRLPVLLGLYTDEMFKTRKQDGTDAAGDNSVERNHGKAIRKYVSLLTGQEMSSDIAYEYVPGPFMRVYVNALKSARSANPKPYLLLIEEINRANVAAVFGDIFQLLDRDEDEVSEYPIQASEDIKKYLAKELDGNPEDYNKIKIPDNMFIWATMNSADQGVFPMDTAFKRRWDFTYIGIDDNDDEIQGKYVILGNDTSQKVEWNKLRKAINRFLAKQKINEDKQLGPYFLSRKIVIPESGDEIDRDRFCEAFKNKVIMYLFEDAAKQKRPSLFEGCFDSSSRYSEICKEFDEKGVGIFNHEIGLDTDLEDIKINGTETGETAEETE